MSENHATSVKAPEISKDGKTLRLVLCDSNGEQMLPLVVSRLGAVGIINLLSKVTRTAEITEKLSTPEDAQGYKPTPLMFQAKEFDLVVHTQPEAVTLVVRAWDSTELHLVFRPSLLRHLLSVGQQAVDTQFPDSDTVN